MLRRPPISTRTDTLCPFPTLVRSKRHGGRDPAQRPLLHLGRGNRVASAEFCCGGRECGLLFARVTARKLRIELAKDRENLRFADFVEEGFRARPPMIGCLDLEQRPKLGLEAVFPTARDRKSTRLNSSH